MTHSKPVDTDVLSRAQEGDAEAFSTLLGEHREGLFAYLARSTGDQDQAADLLQVTLIRAWKALPTYQDRGRFEGWLFTLARRVFLDEKRREGRRPTLAYSNVGQSVAGPGNPFADAAAGQLEAAISDAVHQLPEVRRTVFLMRHHSSLTFKEIAETLGIPVGTALSHMHHALRSLKAVLELHDVSIP